MKNMQYVPTQNVRKIPLTYETEVFDMTDSHLIQVVSNSVSESFDELNNVTNFQLIGEFVLEIFNKLIRNWQKTAPAAIYG